MKIETANTTEQGATLLCVPMRWRKRLVRWVAWGIAAMLVAWGVSAFAIYWASDGRIFNDSSLDKVPHSRAAVVLGCRKVLPSGFKNLYFTSSIFPAGLNNFIFTTFQNINPP